jgi:hypothetical protein
MDALPFFPGGIPEASGPLWRFLPPTPDGPARAFLQTLRLPGAWVLDPFGASPRLTVEMARTGQRVLVAAGNPVSRFLLDLAAHPPHEANLRAALADLAAARKEGQRLELLIQSMYLTRCLACGRELPAEAFLWDSTGLVGRIYQCSCGSGGEQPVTPEDVERAAVWSRTQAMHRSRALERVTALDDPDRPFAEEALDFYQPRAIYALDIIIHRLDSLSASDERRRCLTALVLWTLDAANSLWPHLAERPRPKQLTLPGVFRENNVWRALEAGIQAWAADAPALPLTLWPEEPPETGGICVFEGAFRSLAADLDEIPIKAVMGAIPRPNQAFWTLSALWSGWLWGRAAVGPFKAVLRRRRYDWQWHAEALRALFGSVSQAIPPQTPCFALLAEAEPDFLTAAILAAQTAGLELGSLSMRGEQEALQIHWRKAEKSAPGKLPLDANFVRKALRDTLDEQGKPLPYLRLHAAALTALAQKGMLRWSEEALPLLEKTIQEALGAPEFIDLDTRANPETGKWALRKWGNQGSLQGM